MSDNVNKVTAAVEAGDGGQNGCARTTTASLVVPASHVLTLGTTATASAATRSMKGSQLRPAPLLASAAWERSHRIMVAPVAD